VIPTFATIGKVHICTTCMGSGRAWSERECYTCDRVGFLFGGKTFKRNGVVHIPSFTGHELEVPCCWEKQEARFENFRQRLEQITAAEERLKKAQNELRDAERWLHEIRRGPHTELT